MLTLPYPPNISVEMLCACKSPRTETNQAPAVTPGARLSSVDNASHGDCVPVSQHLRGVRSCSGARKEKMG